MGPTPASGPRTGTAPALSSFVGIAAARRVKAWTEARRPGVGPVEGPRTGGTPATTKGMGRGGADSDMGEPAGRTPAAVEEIGSAGRLRRRTGQACGAPAPAFAGGRELWPRPGPGRCAGTARGRDLMSCGGPPRSGSHGPAAGDGGSHRAVVRPRPAPGQGRRTAPARDRLPMHAPAPGSGPADDPARAGRRPPDRTRPGPAPGLRAPPPGARTGPADLPPEVGPCPSEAPVPDPAPAPGSGRRAPRREDGRRPSEGPSQGRDRVGIDRVGAPGRGRASAVGAPSARRPARARLAAPSR